MDSDRMLLDPEMAGDGTGESADSQAAARFPAEPRAVGRTVEMQEAA